MIYMVDDLAQWLRTVDGDHKMGAGALAEALVTTSPLNDWLREAERRGAVKALREVADSLWNADQFHYLSQRADEIERA